MRVFTVFLVLIGLVTSRLTTQDQARRAAQWSTNKVTSHEERLKEKYNEEEVQDTINSLENEGLLKNGWWSIRMDPPISRDEETEENYPLLVREGEMFNDKGSRKETNVDANNVMAYALSVLQNTAEVYDGPKKQISRIEFTPVSDESSNDSEVLIEIGVDEPMAGDDAMAKLTGIEIIPHSSKGKLNERHALDKRETVDEDSTFVVREELAIDRLSEKNFSEKNLEEARTEERLNPEIKINTACDSREQLKEQGNENDNSIQSVNFSTECASNESKENNDKNEIVNTSDEKLYSSQPLESEDLDKISNLSKRRIVSGKTGFRRHFRSSSQRMRMKRAQIRHSKLQQPGIKTGLPTVLTANRADGYQKLIFGDKSAAKILNMSQLVPPNREKRSVEYDIGTESPVLQESERALESCGSGLVKARDSLCAFPKFQEEGEGTVPSASQESMETLMNSKQNVATEEEEDDNQAEFISDYINADALESIDAPDVNLSEEYNEFPEATDMLKGNLVTETSQTKEFIYNSESASEMIYESVVSTEENAVYTEEKTRIADRESATIESPTHSLRFEGEKADMLKKESQRNDHEEMTNNSTNDDFSIVEETDEIDPVLRQSEDEEKKDSSKQSEQNRKVRLTSTVEDEPHKILLKENLTKVEEFQLTQILVPLRPKVHSQNSAQDRKANKLKLVEFADFGAVNMENLRATDDFEALNAALHPVVAGEQKQECCSPTAGALLDEKPVQKVVLNFPDVPPGENFRIKELGLSDGVFIFSYLSTFLSWIQPYDFPVDLLRDTLRKKITVLELINEALPVEGGFIALLCVFCLLALVVPCQLTSHACCALFGNKQPSDSWSGDSPQHTCRRRGLLFALQLIVVLFGAGVGAMFATNEQLSGAVQNTPVVLQAALDDSSRFLRNAHLQLNFVVTKSLDQAFAAVIQDLDDSENLLGRPIQRELEDETGVDVALEALNDVTTSTQAVSAKAGALQEQAGETRGLLVVARERLADLRMQVELLRRQCTARDRPLCDTVDPSGLDVVLKLDSLLADPNLATLRLMKEGNLSSATLQARQDFQFIPLHVEESTRDARNGVRRQMLRQKSQLLDAVSSLDAVAHHVGSRLDGARHVIPEVLDGVAEVEGWRWLAGLGCSLVMLLVWLLLLAGACCGCCGPPSKARPTIITGAVVGGLVSLFLWVVTMVAMLVGGHAEVFLCRPLHDAPNYPTLANLLDKPGIFRHMNVSLDVDVASLLHDCEENRPVYTTLRLRQLFDARSHADHRRWTYLHSGLAKIRVDLTHLQLLTPQLQSQLQVLMEAAMQNLTVHRMQLSGPVAGKDLAAFADQLLSVASQISDAETANRMETLGTRTRRLLASHMEPLKLRKEDLVYQLTALEVQLAPLQRQVNQSLSHLKTIQYFINNQGEDIARMKSSDYVNRLTNYLQQYTDHVVLTTERRVAPSRPLWDVFHSARLLICRHAVDAMNGFWFSTMWCLMMLTAAIPVCLRLADIYKKSSSGGLLSASSDSPTEHMMQGEESGGGWNTPGGTPTERW